VPSSESLLKGRQTLRCVVCGSVQSRQQRSATGTRQHCGTCFHSWRTSSIAFPYASIAMCPTGTSRQRIQEQCEFIESNLKQHVPVVLEIGCATGELAEAVRSRIPITRYEAIEISPAAHVARDRVDQLFDRPLADLISAGELKVGSFDMIIMSHVLEHMPDVTSEVAAVRSLLRPKGMFFVEVPNGSGNPNLPFDDNISHLHFFSPTSLLWLLARHDMAVKAVTSGARLDGRYPDSLRVAAFPFGLPVVNRNMLSDHPKLEGLGKIAVWGAGTVTLEFLANFFDPSRIAFFIDNSAERLAGPCLGRPVYSPEALLHQAYSAILISSFDHADAIDANLRRICPDLKCPVLRMEDLL